MVLTIGCHHQKKISSTFGHTLLTWLLLSHVWIPRTTTTQQIATGWHADGNGPAQPPHGFQLLVAWNYLTYDISFRRRKPANGKNKYQSIRNDWSSFRFFWVVFVKTPVTLMFLLKRCLPLKCQAVPGLVRTRNDKNPIPYWRRNQICVKWMLLSPLSLNSGQRWSLRWDEVILLWP